MPNISSRLIVLKKTKLAEMDLIITGFSSEGHQVRTVVKGGRKPGSRRGAHLELFSVTQVLHHQGRSSLTTVTEAELIKSHSGCRVDIEHSSAAGAVTELVEVLSRDADADPRLFLLLDACLDAIDGTSVDGLELIVAAALLKVVGQVGFLPNLETCIVCGRPRTAQKSSPMAGSVTEVASRKASEKAETSMKVSSGLASNREALGDDDAQTVKLHGPIGGHGPMAFSFSQGGVICLRCRQMAFGVLTDSGEASVDFPLTEDLFIPADEAIFDWLVLLVRSRFVELAGYATTENHTIGRMLLAFARDWMRAQVTPRNRSVDFLMGLG